MPPFRTSATTLRELLAELRAGDAMYAPILVEIGASESEDPMSTDQTLTTSFPPSWAARFSMEYADQPFLVVQSADKTGAVVRMTIGRSRTCDLCLNDASVSKQHALLEVDRVAGEYFLVDEGSRNGTFVNGERLPAGKRVPLWSGLQVGFGEALYVFIDPPTLKKLSSVA